MFKLFVVLFGVLAAVLANPLPAPGPEPKPNPQLLYTAPVAPLATPYVYSNSYSSGYIPYASAYIGNYYTNPLAYRYIL